MNEVVDKPVTSEGRQRLHCGRAFADHLNRQFTEPGCNWESSWDGHSDCRLQTRGLTRVLLAPFLGSGPSSVPNKLGVMPGKGET